MNGVNMLPLVSNTTPYFVGIISHSGEQKAQIRGGDLRKRAATMWSGVRCLDGSAQPCVCVVCLLCVCVGQIGCIILCDVL